jgi:hypothetical protein
MPSTDPRVLIRLLEDLQEGLKRNTLESRETLHEAERAQAHLHEHSARLARWVRQLGMLIAEDERRAGSITNAADEAHSRSDDALRTAQSTLGFAEATQVKCVQARTYWQGEVTRAERRVRRAEAAAHAARARANAARQELWAAEAALADCEQPIITTDSKGNIRTQYRDCSGCRARVHRARAAVAHAEGELAAAMAELRAAQSDLAHCRGCLVRAGQALQAAIAAVAEGQAACAEALAAVAAASAARKLAEQVQQRADKERQLGRVLDGLARQVDGRVQQAGEQLHQARRHGDVVEDTARLCVNDLSLRADHLRAVDASFPFS